MTSSIRRIVLGSFGALRTTWLVFGVSLAILLLMESCARVVRAAGDARRPQRIEGVVPGDPQSKAPWFADFIKEYDATRPQRWKSYVYFGRLPSFSGRYVNIDSAGHRVTPQRATPVTPAKRVFFFGGSTLWGTAQRDDHTIPAEVARRLAPVTGPDARIAVSNFGESGYVTTQELLALMLELRAGQRPDVVVFYDGINDVGTTVQYGAAGIPQNESKRVAEFDMGRAIDRTGFEHGFRKDLKAWGALGAAAVKQLALFEWAQSHVPATETSYISADSAARSTVRVYVENARIIESLGRLYGFTPIFVWQPSLHGTAKRLTPFESKLMEGIDRAPFQRRIKETQLVIPRLLDSAMADVAPNRFVNAAGVFRDDTMAVFVDRIGHTTETAVPRIVDAFWPVLDSVVRRSDSTSSQLAKPPIGRR